MRVCVVSDQAFPPWGGEGVATEHLCHRLAGRGHQVLVLTSRVLDPPELEGIEIRRFPSVYVSKKGHFALTSMGQVARCLEEYRPDVVQVNLPTVLGMQSSRAARKLGVPLVAGFHVQARNVIPVDAYPMALLRGALEYWFTRFYRGVALAISPSHLGKSILEGYGARWVEVVSNGVDCSRFSPQAVSEGAVLELRARMKLGDSPVILYVGRLSREKNVAYLLKVMLAQERVSGLGRFAKLLVVGTGELSSSLQRQTARSGLAERIRFAGFLSGKELLAAYKMADIFILPSLCELQSIVTLEALAMGCAIMIARSRESAAQELVQEGVNGFTFSLHSPEEAAERIETILRAPSPEREMMSRACMLAARAHDWHHSISRVEQLYAALTSIPAEKCQ